MQADTFAKLVILETLIDAEVGFWLEHHPISPDRFREGLVARVSDLLDEIDRLDEVASGRVYDALVDFLSGLPDDDDMGIVAAALRFKRAVDRLTDRALEPRDRDDASTWAVVLDELLEELAAEYPACAMDGAGGDPRACIRARALARAARDAGERMVAARRTDSRTLLRDDLDRLYLAVEHRAGPAAEVESLIRAPQRIAQRARPSSLRTMGAYVMGQLLSRRPKGPRNPRDS